MLGYSALIQSFIDCISQLAKYSTSKVEHQESTNIISDKKNLKEATNIAENIILIANKYKSFMSKRDQRKLTSFIKKFNKYN
nr:MAG TPA: hypothetical protein [Caudoviricetes sp.]